MVWKCDEVISMMDILREAVASNRNIKALKAIEYYIGKTMTKRKPSSIREKVKEILRASLNVYEEKDNFYYARLVKIFLKIEIKAFTPNDRKAREAETKQKRLAQWQAVMKQANIWKKLKKDQNKPKQIRQKKQKVSSSNGSGESSSMPAHSSPAPQLLDSHQSMALNSQNSASSSSAVPQFNPGSLPLFNHQLVAVPLMIPKVEIESNSGDIQANDEEELIDVGTYPKPREIVNPLNFSPVILQKFGEYIIYKACIHSIETLREITDLYANVGEHPHDEVFNTAFDYLSHEMQLNEDYPVIELAKVLQKFQIPLQNEFYRKLAKVAAFQCDVQNRITYCTYSIGTFDRVNPNVLGTLPPVYETTVVGTSGQLADFVNAVMCNTRDRDHLIENVEYVKNQPTHLWKDLFNNPALDETDE